MNFWRGVFSDNNQPSFSRVASGLIVAFSCGWVSHLVWHNHELPDFAGLCLLVGTLYGLNVVKNSIAKPTGGSTPPPSGN